MIDDAPSALTTLVSAWKAYKPSFLWVPTAGKLLTDQVRGVRGRIVGKALLAPGGIINPVANSATGYLSFPTNANTTGAGRAFLGAMIVYVKDPASVTGSFVKVGGDSDGVGFGAGNSTFEDSGTKAMGLVEAIAWQPGTANFFCRGVNVIVFGYDTSKVVRMYNQTTGIDSSVAGGYTVISPSNIIRINGYLTNRTSNVQVCAVAVFGNVAPTTADTDKFIKATRPAGRAIGRMGRGGLDSLFRARYDGLPENLSAGGGATNLIIQDALHGHTADNLGLTLDTFLAVQEALHSHAADNLTLSTTGSTDLTLQDASHAHTADNLALTLDTFLLLQDALHAHAADNITLSTGAVADLVIQEALHAHTADALVLTLDTFLVIQEAAHAHSADNIAFTLDSLLAVQEATHGHLADNLILSIPGSALSDAEFRQMYDWISELHLVHGLRAGSPLTVTPTTRAAGTVDQTIGEVGTTVTVTRI